MTSARACLTKVGNKESRSKGAQHKIQSTPFASMAHSTVQQGLATREPSCHHQHLRQYPGHQPPRFEQFPNGSAIVARTLRRVRNYIFTYLHICDS